jgi:hypothetical protein
MRRIERALLLLLPTAIAAVVFVHVLLHFGL